MVLQIAILVLDIVKKNAILWFIQNPVVTVLLGCFDLFDLVLLVPGFCL